MVRRAVPLPFHFLSYSLAVEEPQVCSPSLPFDSPLSSGVTACCCQPTCARAALRQLVAHKASGEGSKPAETRQSLSGVLEPTSPACLQTASPLRERLVVAAKGCHGELDSAQMSNDQIWYPTNGSIGHFCSVCAPTTLCAHLSAAR